MAADSAGPLKIATIVGARPQFIKAAVVSRALREHGRGAREIILHTGQHYDANMSDVFFEELEIPRPDHHLGIGGGTHGQNTGRMIEAIEAVLMSEKPDWVLVYGDTDSTLAGTLAAVKLHIPVAHVEAGLRSFNRRMPEEINRVLTDHAASLLFAPTTSAVDCLRKEGVPDTRIHLVGDVMYDAALYYGPRAQESIRLSQWGVEPKRYVLCTMHRQENTDDPARMRAILDGLLEVNQRLPVVLPLHPRTRKTLAQLGYLGEAQALRLLDPVGYLEMQRLTSDAAVVMTDSGGLQKEAYFHKVPCITLRDETEWMETVTAGWNLLAKADADAIIEAFDHSQDPPATHPSLYGDGSASAQVIESLL